jgi:hypothetical protein
MQVDFDEPEENKSIIVNYGNSTPDFITDLIFELPCKSTPQFKKIAVLATFTKPISVKFESRPRPSSGQSPGFYR